MTKLDVLNPATNEVIKILEYTDEQTAHRQIERAHEAFQSWKKWMHMRTFSKVI